MDLKDLIDYYIVLDSSLKRTFGLMFKSKLINKALIFKYDAPQKLPIHMLFVFQSIDVIWLNGNKVVDYKTNVRPFTPLVFHKGLADCFIELPAGTIKTLGDTLEI
jgi:uncharacterized membrane protein (UPF0127 family)